MGDGHGSDRLSPEHGALSGREADTPLHPRPQFPCAAQEFARSSRHGQSSHPAGPVRVVGPKAHALTVDSRVIRSERSRRRQPVRSSAGILPAQGPPCRRARAARCGSQARPGSRAAQGRAPSRTKVAAERFKTRLTPERCYRPGARNTHTSAPPVSTKPASRIQQMAKPTRHPTTENKTPTTENQTPTITEEARGAAWPSDFDCGVGLGVAVPIGPVVGAGPGVQVNVVPDHAGLPAALDELGEGGLARLVRAQRCKERPAVEP